MASLSPVLKQTFFDANGNPLAAGKLYSYVAGTTTPLATYTDSSGTTANANPVILNSAGQANVWVTPGSYKFELRNAANVTQWTTDNVLVQAEIPSLSKGDILGGGSGGTLSKTSAGSDGQYLAAYAADSAGIRFRSFLPPTIQRFTSGSSGYKATFVFEIATGSVIAGDTYTNNGATFTIVDTVSFGTTIYARGDGIPLTSGTLTLTIGTGDATVTFRAYRRPIAIEVDFAGGGGGGGGGGTSGSAGGLGVVTTFGTSLLTANGGGSGRNGAASDTGGSVTINSPALTLVSIPGAPGGGGGGANTAGGMGGATPFGGAGDNGAGGFTAGRSAQTNSGSGGGGGGCTSSASGSGGPAGGYGKALIPNPSTTYNYSVGAGGSAGAAGTGGGVGGAGGSGVVIVKELFQ